MRLVTDAIDDRGTFDPRYTCDVDNSSPELRWESAPPEARSFVVTMEDVTSGAAFVHWLVCNIPGELRHLPAGIPPQDLLPNGIRQGLNGYGKLGYAGPCPPRGARHHEYAIRLYALRDPVEVSSRLSKDELWPRIAPAICAMAELRARYERLAAKAG